MNQFKFDESLTMDDLLRTVNEKTLVSDLYDDVFYKTVIDTLVSKDIDAYDIEELRNIVDSSDRTALYRQEIGDGTVLDLLRDNGYENDMISFIVDNY